MIENKLQYYQKTANYEKRKNAGEISDEAIVFVEEAHDIVVRGNSFGLSDGAVTYEKIAKGAVKTDSLENNAVTADKISNNAVTTNKIASGAVSSDKIQERAVGTNHIANNAIISDKIAQGAVTSAKIANKAVIEQNLADECVTTSKLDDNSITETKIVNGSISEHKLADESVSETKIIDRSVTTSKLADNSVSTAKLKEMAVTSSKLANNAVTEYKIANNAVSESKIADGAVTTDKLGFKSITADKIADDVAFGVPDKSIIEDKIADSAITSFKIADRAITEPKLADKAVSTRAIADNAVGKDQLANNAIVESKIADLAVTTDKLAGKSVTSIKIADQTIATSNLANQSVTNAKIEDGCITLGKLSSSVISNFTDQVDAKISELVGSAPQTLDTLQEIAEALQNNPDVIKNILEQLGNKVDSSEVTGLISEALRSYSVSWNDIASRPTTLSGYGIRDAYISGNTIHLGSNSINVTTDSLDLSTYTVWGQKLTQTVTGKLSNVTEINMSGNLVFTNTTGKTQVYAPTTDGLSIYCDGGIKLGPSVKVDTTLTAGERLVVDRTDDPNGTTGGSRVCVKNSFGELQLAIFERKGLYDPNSGNWLIAKDRDRETKIFVPRIGDSLDVMFGVNLNNPEYTLHVAGDGHFQGECSATGFPTTSDETLKDITGNIEIDAETIANAPAIIFDWKKGEGSSFGTIAQYWQKINDSFVNESKNGTLMLQYGNLAMVAVINLAKEVVELKKQIEELKNKD